MKKHLRQNKHQIFRFIISGLISTCINFFVYNLIYLLFKNIIFASILGYSIGLLTSFILAKIWVFRGNSQNKILKSLFIFCIIYLLGGLEMSVIIFCMNHLLINHRFSWLCGTAIAALNNYLGSKYFLFKK